jgi:hypothetical protein
MIEIDIFAVEMALRCGMPPDVHIPIGARDINSIIKYIGHPIKISSIPIEKAFILTPHHIPLKNSKLPLWKENESHILHSPKQIWVHVDYRGYRSSYIKACPEINVNGYFLDHILNRRVARLKGFYYLRIIPVLPSVNTSSGGVTEKYGFEYHSSDYMKKKNSENKASIEYADLADIVKMLNLKTGGQFQDIVNDCQYLLEEQ